MAEVLSVVASAIAVGQLTTQILGSVKTLYTFLSYIKDAPHAITDMVKELEILGDLLRELQVNFLSDESSISSTATMHNCVKLCGQAADNIAAVVTKLEKGLGRRKVLRQWTAIQATLRKGELDELQNRLSRAKSLLNLAINCYTFISNRKQQQLLDRVLAVVSEDTTRATKQFKPHYSFYGKPRNSYSITRATAYGNTWLVFGRCIQKSTSQRAVDDDQQETLRQIREWHFFPRQWLPLTGFRLKIIQVGHNLQYVLNPTRVVPIESPIFQACWKGDISEMRRIISQAGHADPDMCHWLLENGADGNAVNSRGETALHSIESWIVDDEYDVMSKWKRNSQQRPERFYETARKLVELGQIDPLALSVNGLTPLDQFWGPVKALRFLVSEQQVFEVDLEFSQLGLKLAQRLSLYPVDGITDSIRFLLGDGPISPSVIQQRFSNGSRFEGTLLTSSVRRLTILFQIARNVTEEVAFISDLIQGGADVHEFHGPDATCLDLILMTWRWGDERNRQELILEWLKCLHVAGIDLQEYFRKEEYLHQQGKVVETMTYRPGIEHCFSIVYGPSRDDITIKVRDNITMNREENKIPGAWDTESEFVEDHGLELFDGTNVLADWTVSTSGFSSGDYSVSRACIGRL